VIDRGFFLTPPLFSVPALARCVAADSLFRWVASFVFPNVAGPCRLFAEGCLFLEPFFSFGFVETSVPTDRWRPPMHVHLQWLGLMIPLPSLEPLPALGLVIPYAIRLHFSLDLPSSHPRRRCRQVVPPPPSPPFRSGRQHLCRCIELF